MLCALDRLLEGCFHARPKNAPRSALLIEGFPRPQHPIVEFAKLLFLLQEYRVKATFVVDWQEIRERGLGSSVGEMMKLLKHYEHEVAIKFKGDVCGARRLNQHTVEALHFMQRVYGITIESVKVDRPLLTNCEIFASHGLAVFSGGSDQVVVRDTEYVVHDVALALRGTGGREWVRVNELGVQKTCL